MTTEQTYEPMTEAEVQAFAAKSQAWWDELTTKEQALVREAIRSASPDRDDVQGYYSDVELATLQLLMFGDPLPALRLAVTTLLAPPSTSAPSGPGGSTGGTLGTRTSMN
jgi:hypothetical protein